MKAYLISHDYDMNYLAILEFWYFRWSYFNRMRDYVEKIVQIDVEVRYLKLMVQYSTSRQMQNSRIYDLIKNVCFIT